MRLRLTLEVTYDMADVEEKDREAVINSLYDGLSFIADNAAGNGLLSGDTEAIVDTWHANVEKVG